MKESSGVATPLAHYLYKIECIERITSPKSLFYQRKTLNGMLLVKEGEGEIVIDGRSHSLRRQTAFLLPPGGAIKLRILSGRQAEFYYLQFYALQAAEKDHYVPAQLDCPDDIHPAHFPALIDSAREIENKLRTGNGWDAMKANILFQEMVAALFMGINNDRKSDIHQAIRLALEYMDQHYRQDITREQLAEIAGLNPDYFSRAFKKRLGISPTEYLTEARIRHAKQLLVQSGESSRSIARSVGFNDEFYFSRKFKAKTGSSPIAYVKKVRNSAKIASLNHVATGHLIALGIEPYAAVINNAYPVMSRLRDTIAIGQSVPDLEKLMTASPELIVARGNRQTEKSPKERMIDQIAPSITLDYAGSWREHFQTIAKIVGKEKEADDWLDRYETKAETIRRQIPRNVREETLLIVGVGNGKICVYGQRNIGTVLYGDLQLAAPEGVSDITHYKEMEPADLLAMDADRILLTSYKHDGNPHMDRTVRTQLRELLANRDWNNLRAVRNGNVYGLLDSRHLYTSYNALSHDLFLDKAFRLLTSE
ncbi:MAG: AraC family transcriptional regulator [Paenibacillus sp.]|nr:AraC family transcriptional regulator [Paenibacillus sp.]